MRDKFEMLRVFDMVEWGLLGAADAGARGELRSPGLCKRGRWCAAGMGPWVTPLRITRSVVPVYYRSEPLRVSSGGSVVDSVEPGAAA